MKLKKKNLFILIIVGVLLVGLGVIGFTKLNKKKEDTPIVQNEEKDEEKKNIKIIDMSKKTRPYAVMINNISVARPLHSGLQDAYLIYEIIVEGGITRYLALFMNQDTDRIGSIRSSRHYYLDYVLENDAIYVHNGQSPQAKEDFSKLKINRLEVEEGSGGIRDKSLNVSKEHTLFTSIELLNDQAKKKNFRTERNKELLLNYSVEEVDLSTVDGVKEANDISIKYSNNTTSSYKYDEVNKVYKRFVNNKEHTDYVTKEQYTFKNIIAYDVDNYTLQDAENKGRQGINNIGKGNGYYITDGYAVPITWEKESRESQTVYKYLNGKEIDVNDGNTFIQIYPDDEKLTIS